MLRRHPQCSPGALVVLQEIPQLGLADLHALRGSGVGHLHHWPEQVEAVGDVGAAADEKEEDEEDGVAEDWRGC